MSIQYFRILLLFFSVILLAADSESAGQTAFQNRDFRTAEKIFLRLTQDQQANAHVWKLLGMTYAAEEKFNLAEPAFYRSCILKNEEENACYYLARTNFTLGRAEKALQFYKLALPVASTGGGRGAGTGAAWDCACL